MSTAQNNKLFTEEYDFSPNYGVTQLTLMVRDPHWIYAYWEVTPQSLDCLKSRLSDQFEQASYVLRFYDVTLINFDGTSARKQFDVELKPDSHDCYVQLQEDGVSYCADLGIKTQDGQFYSLTRSNFVHTPRTNYSPNDEILWMDAHGAVETDQQMRQSLEEKKAVRKAEQHRRLIAAERSVVKQKPLMYLQGKSLRAGGASEQMLMSSIDASEQEGLSFIGASEHVQGSQQFGESSNAVTPEKNDFFFELNTEMVVYGQTEPDADVYFEGRKVELNSDGTFSLRLNLPNDTTIPLKFLAKLAKKNMQRQITTAAIRTSTYCHP